MDIAELVKNAEARRKEFVKVRDGMAKQIQKIFNDRLERSGTTAKLREKTDPDLEYWHIDCPSPNGGCGWEIELYVTAPDWQKAEIRKFGISCCGFGKIDTGDHRMKMYELMGVFAQESTKINQEIQALDWKNYEEAKRASWKANALLKDAEDAIEKAETAKKEAEIRAKLSVGVEVITAKATKYQQEVVEKITKITAKRLWFKEWAPSKSIEAVVTAILNGTYALK